jgi:hypothetical protein
MDKDAIDLALHEIQQMVEVASRSAETLCRAGGDNETFQMPAADANLLDFSIFDIEKRIKAVRAMLLEGDRPVPVKPLLSIVRDQA